MGRIEAICISTARGTQKRPVGSAEFVADWGIRGDAHGGHWHRQVSLLSADRIDAFRARGAQVENGAFGENLDVRGFDFSAFPVGTLFKSGDVLLELTQIGKECHQHCAIYQAVGDCIMPREGVFARVIRGGIARTGDELVLAERRERRPYQAAVITLSDKGSQGKRQDTSGPAIAARLKDSGYDVVETLLLPDEAAALRQQLCRLADHIVTTGGTGFSPRDITPEATMAVADRIAPGIAEAMRAASLRITPRAMLSRAVSVIRKGTLIINLPGSEKACQECMDVFLDTIPHGLDLLRGESGDCARK